MIRFLALICCVLTLGSVKAQDLQLVDKVVGVVADDIILLSDIEIQYEQYKAQGEEVTSTTKCQILDQLMLDKLFLAQAIVDSIVVMDDEVDAELDRRIRYFISMFGSKDKLEEYYGKSILALKEEFRSDIYDQMLSDKMQRQIFANLSITPSEVKEFFNSIPEDSLPFFNAEVSMAQLVVMPKVSKAQRDYALEKIEGIRKSILEEGADFATQAIIYSEDGSAPDGGDLGMIERGEMVRDFEAAAFRLNEREVSDVVETQFGYHLIYVDERKGERIRARHILIRPKITRYELEAARVRADSIYNLIAGDSMTFANAVQLYSEDDQTKSNGGIMMNPNTGSNWFEMSEVEGTVTFAIENLSAGEVTAPLGYTAPDGSSGYRIIKLVEETLPHKADLQQDYEKIRAAATQQKKQEELVDWIKQKKDETYIFVDEAFFSCFAMDKWRTKN